MKVLITGQGGFIGGHLKNTLQYIHKEFSVLECNSNIINDKVKLDQLISKSDIIVHLAGVNRTNNEKELYEINYNISKLIDDSLIRVKYQGKLIFASSTQETLGNNYGKAKKHSRELFIKSSKKLDYKFCGLIIPNVYGPFCRSNYNSFISTFSYNLINGIKNLINEEANVELIYIDNLIKLIINEFKSDTNIKKIISYDIKVNVLETFNKLKIFHDLYVLNGEIPKLESDFEVNLFNTFRSFLYSKNFFPVSYNVSEDERGKFSELVRSNCKGQFSFSTTNKKFVRGNHFHTRKIERFSVIQGKAKIQLRNIGNQDVLEYILDGNDLSYVDIPVWFTHNIENIGSKPLITTFWTNEFYEINNTDTFLQKV